MQVATALPERPDRNSSAPGSPPPPSPPLELAALFAAALDRHRAGAFVEAAALYGRILALSPGRAEVHSNLGAALASLGRHAEAETSYRSAIRLTPDYSGAHNNLGNALKVMGRLDEAETAFRTALALKPDYPEAHSNLGVTLAGVGRLDEAVAAYRRAIAIKPDFAGAYNNLANALRELGRLDAAEAACRHALALQPDYAEACANLGNILKDLGRLDEAEAALRVAIALRPEHAEAHSNLGNILIDQGRLDEAEIALRRALALKPSYAGAHNNLGLALKDRAASRRPAARHGRRSGWRRAGRHITAILPKSCVDAGRPACSGTGGDGEGPGRPVRRRPHRTAFRSCQSLRALGQRDASFQQLLAGNALQRGRITYDEAAVLRGMADVEALFTPELIASCTGAGEPSPVPVFIVGMPRSGTTLVEQILASHPEVFGAGELRLSTAASHRLRRTLAGAPAFPEIAARMAGERFRELGARYLGALRRLAPPAAAHHRQDAVEFHFRRPHPSGAAQRRSSFIPCAIRSIPASPASPSCSPRGRRTPTTSPSWPLLSTTIRR